MSGGGIASLSDGADPALEGDYLNRRRIVSYPRTEDGMPWRTHSDSTSSTVQSDDDRDVERGFSTGLGSIVDSDGALQCGVRCRSCLRAYDWPGSIELAYAAAAHAAGKIDDPANWADKPIYLYAGAADSVVNADVVRKAAALYSADFSGAAVTATEEARKGGVTLHVQDGAQHAFSTDVAGYGNACGGLASPFINFCDYDGAGAVLNTIYSGLKPRVDPIDSHVVSIDQAQYLTAIGWTAKDASMADTAYAYVPSGCAKDARECRIHVVYHGCLSYFGAVQDAIYVHTGYNNWAEANDILILYPQTVAKPFVNGQGCWDWYGFLNDDFDTQNGVQIRAVNAMVAALRESVAGAGVQSQLRDYPRSYHNPESAARAMARAAANATARVARCEASA